MFDDGALFQPPRDEAQEKMLAIGSLCQGESFLGRGHVLRLGES